MGGVQFGYGPTGQQVYAQISSRADASIANGSALEVYNTAHWGNYAIATPEQANASRYVLAIPGYLSAGHYQATFYVETVNPGTPTAGDAPLTSQAFDWDGANVIGLDSGLNVGKINGSAPAAVNLGLSANAFAVGAAAAGTLTASQMTTNLAASVTNIYAGRVLYFTGGVNAGLAVLVTAYTVAGGKVTYIGFNNQPAPSAPGVGDSFLII